MPLRRRESLQRTSLAGSRGADLGNSHRARPRWAGQRHSAFRKSLRPRVRAASGHDDAGEGLAALTRRRIPSRQPWVRAAGRRVAPNRGARCFDGYDNRRRQPITEGQDWGASSPDRLLTEIDRQHRSSDDGGWHRDSCRPSEQRLPSSPVHTEGDGIPVAHAQKIIRRWEFRKFRAPRACTGTVVLAFDPALLTRSGDRSWRCTRLAPCAAGRLARPAASWRRRPPAQGSARSVASGGSYRSTTKAILQCTL
jgi:hypothetical protein